MRIYAYHPAGIVREIIMLADDIIPGRDIFTHDYAMDCSEITACNPMPDQGWTTSDGGLTYHPPSIESHTQTQFDFLAFLTLFTSAEQSSVVNSTDTRVKLFCLMAAGARVVDLSDPRVVQGVQLLENLTLIGKGRAVAILAGQPAPAA